MTVTARITGATRVLGIIGDPIRQVRAPEVWTGLFRLNGVDAVFHRPHPAKETDRGALRSVRRFLREAGVTP